MNTALHELYTTRLWNLRYDAFTGLRDLVLHNIRHHVAVDAIQHDKPNVCISTRSSGFQDRLVLSSDPQYAQERGRIAPDDEFITILYAEGPLTRNGDGCSYGSKEHRDMILWASKQSNCIGHLFIIDGPGGSSWCKNDYFQAISAARSAHQPVIALVDGMCASAHQCLAALCDECYYTNPKNEFGCIGTLAAFFTNKDGDIDSVTQERYVEVYATGSPNKNIEFREAAEGNYEKLQEEVDKDAEEFKALVKSHRPNVTEDILSGKVFSADEVEGILNDGQGDLESCVNRIVELHKAFASSAEGGKPSSTTEEQTPNNNHQTMKEYQNIQQACGVEALISDKENGIYATEPMCDALESAIADYKQKENTLEAKLQEIASLNEKIHTIQSEHADAIERLNSEHAAALQSKEDEIATLNSEHADAIDRLNSEHADALKLKEDEISDLNSKISSLDATIAEQQSQISQLSENSAPAPTPSSAPANEGAPSKDPMAVQNVCHEGMTPEERRQALEARMQALR